MGNRSSCILFLFVVCFFNSAQVITGLKCFTCHYEDDDVKSSKECMVASPSTCLLENCKASKSGAEFGYDKMVCMNMTLTSKEGEITSAQRHCTELKSDAEMGCKKDPNDGFVTCYCTEDGCNVELYDPTNDKLKKGGPGCDTGLDGPYLDEKHGSAKSNDIKCSSFFTYLHLFIIVTFAVLL